MMRLCGSALRWCASLVVEAEAARGLLVWGCVSAPGSPMENMRSKRNCDVLLQSMMLSVWKLGHRAVFQRNINHKHTSNMTTALLKKL